LKSKTILITGGGTGGHLSIAKVFAIELNKRGIKPYYVGSTIGQDVSWFKGADFFEKCFFLKSKGFVNKNIFQKILYPISFLLLIIRAIKIIKSNNIYKVVSVGGFSAAPASFAAILLGRELFIHEQNCAMGLLNKILKPYSKIFFSSYLADSPIKDYPVDKKFFDIYRVRENINTILFLGGSQGARAINNFALENSTYLKSIGINIIHQCGKNDYERVKKRYEELGIEVELFPFSTELESYISKADVAVSRSGAGTLWELCAAGVPTLFIPYPYAASDHQYRNGMFLFQKGLCFLCREDKLSQNALKGLLDSDVKNVSIGLKEVVSPDGCAKIIDKILEI